MQFLALALFAALAAGVVYVIRSFSMGTADMQNAEDIPREEIAAPVSSSAPSQTSDLRSVFVDAGTRRGVDPDLLQAVATVESGLRADAVRWNPPRDVSVGLMQILCVPPRDYVAGSGDFMPTNKFVIDGWPQSFEALKNASTNVDLGAQILAWNLKQFGYPRGVAVYNDWAARHASVNGPFPNDGYVAKVLYQLNQLKGGA